MNYKALEIVIAVQDWVKSVSFRHSGRFQDSNPGFRLDNLYTRNRLLEVLDAVLNMLYTSENIRNENLQTLRRVLVRKALSCKELLRSQTGNDLRPYFLDRVVCRHFEKSRAGLHAADFRQAVYGVATRV